MENFEAREAARKGEIEGLQNTLAQLKTSSALVFFLQRAANQYTYEHS